MSRANEVAALSVTREGTQKSFPTAEEMLARHAIGLIDHTSLGLDDTDDKIRSLVDAAVAQEPHTAAVCIYPKFVKLVRDMQAKNPEKYPRSLKVCTVVNFPGGQEPVEKVVEDSKLAVADGADEVDVVIDYKLLQQDEAKGRKAAEELVRAVRGACPEGKVVLKVIIESGELATPPLIRAASEAAIAGGCDFVKTSTGKVKVNATPESAKIMLEVCAAHKKRRIGFKAAGGVKNVEQAKQYLELAAEILLGEPKKTREIDSAVLRFGASSLLPSLRGCCTAEARNSKKRSAQEAGLQGY
jgi:deoxyribose-phosphate aldolase